MNYKKRKKDLLESLIIEEADMGFSDLLPADKVVLSKEEDELEDEADKLITEMLDRFRSFILF